jgi:spore coat polysaccharide biosynthesis protein SpsF
VSVARNVIGVITARMASTRLPGKVLLPMAGKSVFAHHAERMQEVQGLRGVFLATSEDPANEPLIAEAERTGCGWYAGAEQDIVDRHIKLCEREGAEGVIRVTCDSPIFDIDSASRFVAEFQKAYHDYVHVSNMTMIQGTLAELIGFEALIKTHEHYRGAAVSQYIKEHPDEFDLFGVEVERDLVRPEYRLTIDEQADIDMISRIYEALYRGEPLCLKEVYTWLDDNPDVARINMGVGIKGCEVVSAGFTERPAFSVVPSGKGHVVLDDMKRRLEPDAFLDELVRLFPELGERVRRDEEGS